MPHCNRETPGCRATRASLHQGAKKNVCGTAAAAPICQTTANGVWVSFLVACAPAGDLSAWNRNRARTVRLSAGGGRFDSMAPTSRQFYDNTTGGGSRRLISSTSDALARQFLAHSAFNVESRVTSLTRFPKTFPKTSLIGPRKYPPLGGCLIKSLDFRLTSRNL